MTLEVNSLNRFIRKEEAARFVEDTTAPGGLPQVFMFELAAGANADYDLTLPFKIRVIDSYLVLTGAGVASSVTTVKNGSNAITSTMAASGSDKALVRITTIDDAYHEIAGGGTLRVTTSAGVSAPAQTVYVVGVRVP